MVSDDNPIFKLASDFVNDTDRAIFLTGKAGSGKTTFLRHIVSTTHKKAIVVAPTGVAAINAGGVTIHSMFQLFGPFIPGAQKKFNGVEVSDPYRLFKNMKMSEEKRRLLEELELLIIDEVSMVRCDMLDAVDAVLRHFRKKPSKPFGGVQVLYIGDLFQLPPVARSEEWEILKDFYESPFFFHSQVVAEQPPLYIELKKIYRQSDADFIELLNRVRNNQVRDEDLALLNGKLKPDFRPSISENYITLCTHNNRADAVNNSELAKLPASIHRFRGTIEGDFSEKALPTDMELQLKEGAQVIFIKNDSDPQRRYYNGKIAIVKSIDKDQIVVQYPESETTIKLDRETWRNIRYAYNQESGSIDEEEIGSYKQFPVRLAWAITIHKSQGLTFEKAIIDAGSSFAAGQVYVALSRCTTLNGIQLHSLIRRESISTDQRVIDFARKEQAAESLELMLAADRDRYLGEQLIRIFDFTPILDSLNHFLEEIPRKKLEDPQASRDLGLLLRGKTLEMIEVGKRFQGELEKIFSGPVDIALLQERCSKAIGYFTALFRNDHLAQIKAHEEVVKKAPKIKSYLKLVRTVKLSVANQVEKLAKARYGEVSFGVVTQEEKDELAKLKASPPKKKRGDKGSSLKETLTLFKAGKTIKEIAAIRDLAYGTVETHLAELVKEGSVDVRQVVEEGKLKRILAVVGEGEGGTMSMTVAKRQLGDDISFGEIRAVIASVAHQGAKAGL